MSHLHRNRWKVVTMGLATLMLLVFSSVYAATIEVTPGNPQGWITFANSGGGSSAITTTAPRSGLGSVELTGDRTRWIKAVDPTVGGAKLGDLSDVTDFAFDWMVAVGSTSSLGANYTPALRLHVYDPSPPNVANPFSELIWEGAYNGPVVVTQGTWVTTDMIGGGQLLWRWVTGVGLTLDGGGAQINQTVSAWDNPTWYSSDAVVYGISVGAGSSVGAGYHAFSDNLVLGFSSAPDTFNFEPNPVCTTVCYADAVGGNDANGGTSPADAKQTIQAAIDAVQAGGEVRVLPGSYDETASNRFLFDASGPYQFGLFIDDDTKDGITIQGVTAADVAITDPSLTEATITTNATNSFGHSGIFVEADDVTIAGLEISDNTPGNNKTIEVIGDGFTFKDSFMNVSDGGSLYFGDWRYDTGTTTSYIQSYTVDNNIFSDGSSVDITSGAGYSGPVAGRQITNNAFEFSLAMYTASGNASWPNVSFTGDTTTVPWFVYPVGAAVITGNTFTNNAPDGRHIRARGIADDSQFDWESYWNDNTFNKAVIVGPNLFDDVRSYDYACGAYQCNDVRQIGAVIQQEIDHAVDGDTVLVNEGTYPESPTVDKSITLLAEDGRDLTFIELQTATNYTHSLLITGADVTIDGFTIVGIDAACPTVAATNIYLNTAPDNVVIQNNRLRVGLADGGCTTGDDGFGLITQYSGNPDVASLTVDNNIFEPLTAAGGQRAFYINPSIVDFTFSNNSILGKFVGTAITEAQNNQIEDNTITGDGSSAGIGVWGYLDPGVWGTGTIQRNTISGTVNAISIYDAENVLVTKNILNANGTAVRVLVAAAVPFDQSTIHINRNAITNQSTIGVNNQLDQTEYGDIDATCNWWGAADGPGPVGPGSGDTISADATYEFWLLSNNLDGYCGPPPESFCPVDAEGVASLRTDVYGTGQLGRNGKVSLPNYQDVDSLYGQLAAVDVGVMKWVRFSPKNGTMVQVNAPTSPAVVPGTVQWWGADLDSAPFVKGAFFWGKKGNRAPRAFVLWPTYNTGNEQYANAYDTFDSPDNYAYWSSTPIAIQTLTLPPTAADGAEITVNVALVDVNKDNRSVILKVEVGGVEQTRVITVPNMKKDLNLETFVFENVAAGASEVKITLESPVVGGDYPFGGDSAAMIGASANYACAVPDLEPVR